MKGCVQPCVRSGLVVGGAGGGKGCEREGVESFCRLLTFDCRGCFGREGHNAANNRREDFVM